MRYQLIPLPLICVFTLGCATQYSSREVNLYISQGVLSAQEHAQNNQPAEAILFTEAVLKACPTNTLAIALHNELDKEMNIHGGHSSILGMNRSQRIPVLRSRMQRVLLYFPDRILDFFDIVSAELHFEPGAYVDYHVTRAVQVSAGTRAVAGLGWHDQRCLGVQSQTEAGVNVLCFGSTAYSGDRIGTSGFKHGRKLATGVNRPSEPIYQEFNDYWAIGASATVIYGGLSVDLHPIEIVDFLLGIITIDIGHDDFANTRGVKLTRLDRKLLRELSRIGYVTEQEKRQ